MRILKTFAMAAVLAGAMGGTALAGPYILAGTDADDHGSTNGVVNLDGWFFMQRALENLAPNVTNGNKVVVSLGSDGATTASEAANSAFALSTLASSGWTFVNINGASAIADFFAGVGAVNAGNAGIVMLDSSANNVFGGLDGAEEAALTANASALNTFLGQGGGLFSQANSYGFLSALVPSLTVNFFQDSGINLTAAGNAAFPGLTNADLSAGPYHATFANVGAIPVLGVGTSNGLPVIIGSNAGSITDPGETPVPEPASIALLGFGLAGLGMVRRRKPAA